MRDDREVVVYATPTWKDCNALKDFLSARGVKFTNKNVAEDADAREELVSKYGRMATPTLVIGNKMFLGFENKRAEIENVLNSL